MTPATSDKRFCRGCGTEASSEDRFCSACGFRQGAADSGNRIDTGGGNLRAKQITQIADSVIHMPSAPDHDTPTLDVTWSWKSPLTQAVLAWVSLLVGLIGLLAAYQSVVPAIGMVQGKPPTEISASSLSVWALVFAGAAVVFVVAIALLRMAKHETLAVGWSWLPAVTGWGKRIGLASLAGRCTHCDAKLRFASRPTKWLVNAGGGRGKTLERDMFAECVADPERHNWPLSRRSLTADK